MNSDDLIKKFRDKLNQLKRNNAPFQLAVYTTIAAQNRRIFSDGNKSDGSKIGTYNDSDPMYINPAKSPRKTKNKAKGIEGLKPIGKNGDTKFKNGKPHKTAFVKSYKEFKRKIGRKTEFVNLILSGDLQLDFTNSTKPNDVKPQKISNVEYRTSIKRELNTKKLKGLEKKYGTIFKLTKSEKELFVKTVKFELNNFLSK